MIVREYIEIQVNKCIVGWEAYDQYVEYTCWRPTERWAKAAVEARIRKGRSHHYRYSFYPNEGKEGQGK